MTKLHKTALGLVGMGLCLFLVGLLLGFAVAALPGAKPLLSAHQPAPGHQEAATGFARLACEDPADGSTQFCRVYLPSDYSRKDTWPAVVSLHGVNPPNPD